MLNRLRDIYMSGSVKPYSGAPFVHYIQHYLQQSRRNELASRQFWSRYLEDVSPPDLPPSPADPYREVHSTDNQSLSVPVNLREMATRFGVTPGIFLYAAATLVLGIHSDSDDVVFGLVLAGRDAPVDDIYDMLGPTFCGFPFRARIDRHMALGPFLQRIEHDVLEILPHQHYGLQSIKHCGTGAAAACDFRCLVVV